MSIKKPTYVPLPTTNTNSSSGLLIYAALVNLMVEDFLSEEANLLMTKRDKTAAFAWVFLGGELLSRYFKFPTILTKSQAFGMSVVGAFA